MRRCIPHRPRSRRVGVLRERGGIRRLFPKLVRSYALDAIDAQNTVVPNRICVDDAKAVAQNFIRSVATAAETKGVPFATIGLGQTVRVTGNRLAAAALVADERVVHLAAFELGM